MYRNLLFYLFTPIEDSLSYCDEQRALCSSLGLLGKVLVAPEGLNGSVSGTVEATDAYMEAVRSRFPEISFKVGSCAEHTFTKLIVRVRKEIISLGVDVDLSERAPYVSASELKERLDAGEGLVLLDARNGYESEFGTFVSSIAPPIKRFSEFPAFVSSLDVPKDAPIVTFCTGGIRCEKASAYLRSQGFTDVRQLEGGILGYGLVAGSAHWEGTCFVYDQRRAVDMADVTAVHPCVETNPDGVAIHYKRVLHEER